MTSPINATEVALQLAQLARDLDATVKALHLADEDATEKRHAANLAYAHAWRNAEGTLDARKYSAFILTADLAKDADLADVIVRHLRRQIDAIKTRVDVGRSYGAAVRAEIALGQAGGET